jgi:hypothetical protein
VDFFVGWAERPSGRFTPVFAGYGETQHPKAPLGLASARPNLHLLHLQGG